MRFLFLMCLQQFQLLHSSTSGPHLASLLENKLASQITNKGLTLHWKAATMSSVDRPVFFDYGENAETHLFSGISAVSQKSLSLLTINWTFALGCGAKDDTNWKLASWKTCHSHLLQEDNPYHVPALNCGLHGPACVCSHLFQHRCQEMGGQEELDTQNLWEATEVTGPFGIIIDSTRRGWPM